MPVQGRRYGDIGFQELLKFKLYEYLIGWELKLSPYEI